MYAFLRSYLRPGMAVIDVGANVGDVTAVAAECVGSTGRVFAFEANADNSRLLSDRFGRDSRVTVRHAAVGDVSGMVELHLDRRSSKRHSLYPSVVSVRGESVMVPAVRLDDLREQIRRVDLLKIDAQGAEGRILLGARGLLERDRPVVLFELWPMGMTAANTSPADLFALLDRLGYRCVRLSVKGKQKSRPSIDRFLAEATRWSSTNVIAWPPRPRPTLWARVRRRLAALTHGGRP